MFPKFRSKFEKSVWKDVYEKGLCMEYESEYLPYYIRGNYLPDFKLPNGIIVEAKGYFDTRSQIKMKAVKRENPHLDIRLLFMNSKTKVRKGSKMTYADWAIKNGFPFAEKTIPVSWFREKGKRRTKKND